MWCGRLRCSLPFRNGSLDDCKHSEGFTSRRVLQAGRRDKGRERRCGTTVNGQDVLHSNADLLPECAHDHEATTRPDQVFGAVMCRRIKLEDYRVQFYFMSVDSFGAFCYIYWRSLSLLRPYWVRSSDFSFKYPASVLARWWVAGWHNTVMTNFRARTSLVQFPVWEVGVCGGSMIPDFIWMLQFPPQLSNVTSHVLGSYPVSALNQMHWSRSGSGLLSLIYPRRVLGELANPSRLCVRAELQQKCFIWC